MLKSRNIECATRNTPRHVCTYAYCLTCSSHSNSSIVIVTVSVTITNVFFVTIVFGFATVN